MPSGTEPDGIHSHPWIRECTEVWLPRKDSNLDKVIQSHLCYHYTTRQWKGLQYAESLSEGNCFILDKAIEFGTCGEVPFLRPCKIILTKL